MSIDITDSKNERWALMGASGGLGAAFAEKLRSLEDEQTVMLFSRSAEKMEKLCTSSGWSHYVSDFSKETQQLEVFKQLENYQPTHIVYFAGGGPYGSFGGKNWKDHMWCWEVSFLFAAKLLHWSLQETLNYKSPKQFTLVGSMIAEDKGDHFAPSYAAAKHALKGLFSSVTIEENFPLDIRLYSPSYMDTALLPPNAAPRSEGQTILSPHVVAEDMWSWINGPDVGGHRQFNNKLSF